MGMYLREALERCASLEEKSRAIYEDLASQHASQPHLSAAWRELAADGRVRARQLGALAAIHAALNDDGPFVVDLHRRIDETELFFEAAAARAKQGLDPPSALELAGTLESCEMRGLFQELRDLARAAVRKLTDKLYRGAGASRVRCRLDRVERAMLGQRSCVVDQSASSEPRKPSRERQ